MAKRQAPRPYAKYQLLDRQGRIKRSGITSRELSIREGELKREVRGAVRARQVGRRTTYDAARKWEDRQRKGTPPGGRRRK